MIILNYHIIYIAIIIIIFIKKYLFTNKKEIKVNIPTYEYIEWKRLYYKTLVLNRLKDYSLRKYKKKKSFYI